MEDLELLKHAKCSQLKQSGVSNPSNDYVICHITKKELTTYCCRKTRGVEEMTQLIYDLLKAFQGDQGRDTLGTSSGCGPNLRYLGVPTETYQMCKRS